ncbi:MAG: SDR family oxidoreductase [Myxococcales bacterium]|nr:SDR family oxidoreductase [Myxococcales bacterium]MBL0194678.1 SDR family oxidoreductase [Myxococcales bacterium]HQY64920.1 SDR family oxidoreductase [Polyangiaceae bacterium]
MKVLVTGGAGFIGSHIAERLVREGHSVRVLDNLTSGHRENLATIARDVELQVGDVRDESACARAAEGVDVVFHEAAIVSVPYSVEHPRETHAVNVLGTLNVALAARDAGARRMVFACSAAVYGEEPTLPKHEGMRPEPVSPYGVEKIAGEQYLRAFAHLYGLETVSLRYFNVFGPRQDPGSAYSGVISIFADRILRGAELRIYGDGQQTRDFVFVDDVVAANLLASTAPAAVASGQAYNVACGVRTTLLELAATLSDVSGKPLTVTHAEPRAGDVRDSLADIGRARRDLGYAPRVTMRDGLAALVESLAPTA